MAKYIPDSKNHRWVILAPNRLHKPATGKKEYNLFKEGGICKSKECPFCVGNEDKTPGEIMRVKDERFGWKVRVFRNKYPITDLHEVIVHNPDHCKEIEKMSEEDLLDLFSVYQKRIIALRKEGIPIVFRNKGERAGSSITHPHSQIILLPKQINLEALGLEPIKNKIKENEFFVSYCPDFSQYPYEIWIAHKDSESLEIGSEKLRKIDFVNFNQKELASLGLLLKDSIISLRKVIKREFPYNYYIAPIPPFYLRIIPRVVIRGGFELGTGLSTNIVDPVVAAEKLREFSL